MGDDHLGRFDEMVKGVCECFYLARTPDVSTTSLRSQISKESLVSQDTETPDPSDRVSDDSSSPRSDTGVSSLDANDMSPDRATVCKNDRASLPSASSKSNLVLVVGSE